MAADRRRSGDERVHSMLDGAALIIDLAELCNSGRDEETPRQQLGYMLSHRLLATCWHPALLPWVGIRTLASDTASPLIVDQERCQIAQVLANSRADCALIELHEPLRRGRILSLGTIWKGGERKVRHWIRGQDPNGETVLALQRELLNLSQVYPSSGTGQVSLHLDKRTHSPDMAAARGSPVILEGSHSLCLGHLTGEWVGGTKFAVCPASALRQLAPFCVPYRNRFSDIERAGIRWALAELDGEMIRVQVLSTRDRDWDELSLIQPLHHRKVGDLPGLQLERVGIDDKELSLPPRSICLLVLDEELVDRKAFRNLGTIVSTSSRGPILWASVIADGKLRWECHPFLSAGFQVSAERPLRWILDRGARLAAWSSVLEQLRQQIAESRREPPAYRLAPDERATGRYRKRRIATGTGDAG